MVSSTPRPHFTPGKDPVPILREAGWTLGPVWTGGKSRPHRDSIPDRPARSSVAIPTELPGPRREKGYSPKTFSGLSTCSYARVPGDTKKKAILRAPPWKKVLKTMA